MDDNTIKAHNKAIHDLDEERKARYSRRLYIKGALTLWSMGAIICLVGMYLLG